MSQSYTESETKKKQQTIRKRRMWKVAQLKVIDWHENKFHVHYEYLFNFVFLAIIIITSSSILFGAAHKES